MQEIRKILVPVDFQRYTDELAEFAVATANKLAAKVVFFHVVEVLAFYSDFIPTYMPINDEETIEHAKSKMDALVEKSKKTWMGCSGRVDRGDVVDTIVDYVQKGEIDLIIIGTHGAKGLEKILLGSVAERVVKRAPCSALLFKPKKK
jgi:nucleotide-binding universal stress UspA family protein